LVREREENSTRYTHLLESRMREIRKDNHSSLPYQGRVRGLRKKKKELNISFNRAGVIMGRGGVAHGLKQQSTGKKGIRGEKKRRGLRGSFSPPKDTKRRCIKMEESINQSTMRGKKSGREKASNLLPNDFLVDIVKKEKGEKKGRANEIDVLIVYNLEDSTGWWCGGSTERKEEKGRNHFVKVKETERKRRVNHRLGAFS